MLLFMGILLAGLVAATRARAADGAIEINDDCAQAGCFAGDVSGYPVYLAASGHYRLTSNLSGGILFGPGALDVDIDLNGFAIDGGGRCTAVPGGSPTCAGAGVGAAIDLPALAAGSYYTLRLHDGTIRGFYSGIAARSLAGGSSFERLVVSDMAGNGGAIGIDKTQPAAAIRVSRCEVVRNFADGLAANTGAGAVPFKLVVTDSVFASNGNQGLTVFPGSVVTGNRFLDNAGFGFYCSGSGAPAASAVGGNAFLGNKPSLANSEYNCVIRDMGGNVCLDGACP